MSAVQLIVATLVPGLLAPLVSGTVPDVRGLSWPVIGSVATLGAVGTGIAFVIHLRNIRIVGASTASMVTYIIPVFATLVGAVILGERISWYQPVGAALVLLGVAIARACGSEEPADSVENLCSEGNRALAAAPTSFGRRLLPRVGGRVQSGRAAESDCGAGAARGRVVQDHLAGGLGSARAARSRPVAVPRSRRHNSSACRWWLEHSFGKLSTVPERGSRPSTGL